MPVNAGVQYQLAEEEYRSANTIEEKLKALEKMYATCPKHKSSERLEQEIKGKISKFKKLLEKEKSKKKSTQKISIKKEGAATIVLVGTVNSGKSTLLNKLTNAKARVAEYEFTTKMPEVGILDYKGIKIQVIEIPAIVENFKNTLNGLMFLSIVRSADLIVLLFKTPKEKELLDKELYNISIRKIIYNNEENFKEIIWNNLDIIKVYTKMPGKKVSYPPVALKKNSCIEDLAEIVHKDFIQKFRFARVWGKSAKFDGQLSGIKHKLEDDDIVELHLK